MNEQPAASARSEKSNQIRLKLNRLRSSTQLGMFGVAEIAAVAGSAVLLVLVIVSYLYFLVPARSRLQSLELERARLQGVLRSSQEVLKQGRTTEATVQEIADSLDSFENKRLLERTRGRMDLYNVVNDLIGKNGLRNTSGPTYTQLDPLGTKTASATPKSTNTKWQSIYPGIAISLTVEGQYQNLRRFVADMEASKQFIVINSVELEHATETNTPVATDSASTRASLVSLHMDMATYFQRGGGEDNSAQGTTEH